VRNTDPQSGFEQHGFLNLLVAADVAADGGTVCDLVAVLTERNRQTVADWVRALDPARARKWFASFGTCSIHDPVTELVDLALLVPPPAPTLDQGAVP
jgi:hypothetical protein